MSRTGPCCAHNVKDQWWLWSASGIAIYCILLLCLAQSPLASMGVRMKFRPSSSFTCFRNSQRRQSINFLAWFPCTFPPQRVPATAQQNCWAVAGTLCGGKVQGNHAKKFMDCLRCEFLKQVNEDEGRNFILTPIEAKGD